MNYLTVHDKPCLPPSISRNSDIPVGSKQNTEWEKQCLKGRSIFRSFLSIKSKSWVHSFKKETSFLKIISYTHAYWLSEYFFNKISKLFIIWKFPKNPQELFRQDHYTFNHLLWMIMRTNMVQTSAYTKTIRYK